MTLALKATLSARLADGRIRFTTNEDLEEPRTYLAAEILDQFKKNTFVNLIVSDSACENFMIAQRNLKNLTVLKASVRKKVTLGFQHLEFDERRESHDHSRGA